MHADYHGSASTVIKNPNRDEAVSAASLEEAAIATLCRSKAWDSRIVASAWWVNAQQVSKRAETGEYLAHGSFIIRGKKNFLYPNKLEMGASILFRLDDEASLARHANDRHLKGTELVSM